MPDHETRLIQRAQQGDAAACAELYNRHYDAVYRYCYYRVADVALAQDLTGEVFMRMVQNLPRFDAQNRPLLAWLYTVARNLIIDAYRKERCPPLPLEDTWLNDEDCLATTFDGRLQAVDLAAALQHLTEDQRQVIMLKFVENLSNAEVACMLRKPEGAIKSLQHRALAALRRVLEKEIGYER